MNKVLFDSDVIINLLKKQDDTINKLNSIKNSEFYISPIVIAEVYAGAKSKEISQIEELFSYFKVVDIDSKTGKIAGEYANKFKKAYCGISLEDYLISATAKQYDLILWTYNKKHYPMQDIKLLH